MTRASGGVALEAAAEGLREMTVVILNAVTAHGDEVAKLGFPPKMVKQMCVDYHQMVCRALVPPQSKGSK